MVLENVNQVVDVGSIFVGIGVLIILCVISYWIAIIAKMYRGIVENLLHESCLEDILLKQYCSKKGIDLEKEMYRREFLRKPKKNMVKKIHEEIYDDFFGKDKKK